MFVRYAMSTSLVCVTEDELCADVLAKLERHKIRRVPVLAQSKLVGIVSERDLLRVLPTTIGRLERAVAAHTGEPRARDAMHANPLTIDADAHLEDAARLMLEKKIGGLPVTRDGELVGIITESDVFRSFVRVASASGGVRYTLLDREPERARPAGVEPATLCARLGLALHTLMTHETPGGPRCTSLWVSGARALELGRWLETAGFSILSIEEPKGRAA